MMTPAEFKEARLRLGLSQAALAAVLNTETRTVRYWEDESGRRPPNPIACRNMEWFLDGYRPPEWPPQKL